MKFSSRRSCLISSIFLTRPFTLRACYPLSAFCYMGSGDSKCWIKYNDIACRYMFLNEVNERLHFSKNLNKMAHRQELRMLADSMSKLKVVQQKFCDSLENVEKLEKSEKGTSILVPMSSSMYVPGLLTNVSKVTVEIGAGYFAEKTVVEATKYLKRKKDFIAKQIEKIQHLIFEKQSLVQAMAETMNSKIQQQMHSSNVAEQMASMKT